MPPPMPQVNLTISAASTHAASSPTSLHAVLDCDAGRDLAASLGASASAYLRTGLDPDAALRVLLELLPVGLPRQTDYQSLGWSLDACDLVTEAANACLDDTQMRLQLLTDTAVRKRSLLLLLNLVRIPA